MRSASCPSAATDRVCARHHGWMSTTPSWLPLAVAGIGVVGTLAGGVAGALIAQRWADRRDDKAWARERAREHERWRREDEARTFEHRRAVFEDFYEAVKALARMAYDHGYGFTNSAELPGDWHQDAAAKLRRLEFYADRRVASAASAAYRAAWSWGQYGKYDDPDDPEFYERQQRYDDAELELLVVMREALSIPEVDMTLPPPGYSYEASGSPGGDDDDPASEAIA
jgi:hypothetical protein